MSVEKTIKDMLDKFTDIGKEEKKNETETEIKINNEYVSDDGYDLCVMCKAKTEYKTTHDANYREGYIEGGGQLCINCRSKEEHIPSLKKDISKDGFEFLLW